MLRTDGADDEPLLIFGMMNRLGVDPAGGVLPQSALRYAVAQQNCERCQSKPACRKWLDAHEAAAFAPEFCPNGDTFFEIKFDERSRGGR